MAEAFAFLGILLMSLVVALLATFQLVDFLDANGEILLVVSCVAIFAVVSLAVFSAAYARVKRAQALNGVAVALALVAVIVVRATGVVGWVSAHAPFNLSHDAGSEHAAVALELLLPMLLAVLVQWGLVRRRWLRATGDEDLTLWPWVTTTATGLAILNPVGLTLVSTVLRYTAFGFAGSMLTTIAAAAAGVVVVTACIECYIRGRILRRRLAAHPPIVGGRAGTIG
jgi:hypothetical protein